MSAFEDLAFSGEEFSGVARLFPLPNLVLFPHVMQPLHVFEPRYREMLEDAVQDDRLIAMAVLKPGWEHEYEGRPPVYPVACLGRITTYHRLDDGTYNLLLLGLRRVRLVEELQSAHAFRKAKVELCEDYSPPELAAKRRALHRELRRAFLKILPMMPEAEEQLDQLVRSDMALGVLTDLLGYMLDITLPDKEALLEQLDVERRARLLLGHLAVAVADQEGTLGFPPDFSLN